MTRQVARAKSLILQWFDGSDQPREKRGKLSAGIDRFFERIVERDSWSENMTVLLDNSSALKFSASGQNWRAFPCREGLAVSTALPGWGFGWRQDFRDEDVYQILSWLRHYARQYIHRAQVAKALMIAWERDGIVLHPFGSCLRSWRYGAVNSPVSSKKSLTTAFDECRVAWGSSDDAPLSRSRWIQRNTLDPSIHQAVFHFLRGQSLISAGFELEAVNAFDCVMQSLQMIEWSQPCGDTRRNRADLVATLGLKASDGELAEHIYFLRNEFAAHAGGWRWWDTSDYINHQFLTNASDFVHRILKRAADEEPNVRRISPNPTNWSGWFIDHFPIFFNAVWFPGST